MLTDSVAHPASHTRLMLPTTKSGSIRPGAGPRILVAGAAAVVTLLGVSVGQSSATGGATLNTAPRVFAQPWEVTFAHIQAALEGNSGAYFAEQIRRELVKQKSNVPGLKFEGILERLTYRPADPKSKTTDRFKLEFCGIEGRRLTGTEFAKKAALFANRSGFTFRNKGFHVVDAAWAAKEYDLVFVARDKRSTQQGIREVYRMAAIPKRWDRTGWILELDTATGYPIYMGEYALNAHSIDLQSQLIVTSFLTGVRVPDAKDKSWWAPTKVIESMASAYAAVKKALTKSTKYVVPQLSELPRGFRLEKSEVHTDPITGELVALLSFTDGVDRVFVTQQNVQMQARGFEDTIWILDEKGLAQCGFSHHGVSFRVVGRSVRGVVRRISAEIFSRAVVILK